MPKSPRYERTEPIPAERQAKAERHTAAARQLHETVTAQTWARVRRWEQVRVHLCLKCEGTARQRRRTTSGAASRVSTTL